jgi:hypothetical protein
MFFAGQFETDTEGRGVTPPKDESKSMTFFSRSGGSPPLLHEQLAHFRNATLLEKIPIKSKIYNAGNIGVTPLDMVDLAELEYLETHDDDGPVGIRANFGSITNCGGNFFGHRNISPRSYKREVPLWVKSEKKIRQFLLQQFPKLATDERQRERAATWALVINLYYRVGYTHTQIAEFIYGDPRIGFCKIRGIIRSIQKTSRGLRADGRPRSRYGRGKNPRSRRKPPKSRLFDTF